MSVHEPTPFRAANSSVDADRAMKFGVGVSAAPLWATFFTAASAGMAYWWMSAAWTRRDLKSFAPAKGTAHQALRAPTPTPTPTPVLIAEPAPRGPEAGTLAVAAPVAADLGPAVAPAEIAATVEEAKPALVASHGDSARAEAPAAALRKPPVRRKPEPKA